MSNPGTSGLVAFWAMDELTGSRVDKTGVAGSLTEYNSVGAVKGKRGNAANLISANSEYLAKADNLYISMGNFSFSIGFWMQPHAVSTEARMIAKWTTAGNREYQVYITSSQVVFVVNSGTTNYTVTASTFGNLSNNVWYFVMAHYNADTNQIAIGVNDTWNLASGPTGGVNDYANALQVGYLDVSGAQYFDGYIEGLFIYRQRLLTSAERTWLYGGGYGRTYEDIAGTSPPSITITPQSYVDPEPIYVFDETFELLGIVEDYYSLIWAERYNEAGDFELELPIEYEYSNFLTVGTLLYIKISDKIMVVQESKPTRTENEETLLLSGESAEGLLRTRVMEDILTVAGPAEISIYNAFFAHFTYALDSDRNLAPFSQDYPEMVITTEHEDQFDPSTIYDVIEAIAKAANIGFKVVMYNNELYFYVYDGVDRSTAQSVNSWVVFSGTYSEVVSRARYIADTNKTNVVLVLTDDSTYPAVYVWSDGTSEGPAGNEPTGYSRQEAIVEMSIDRTAVTPNLTNAEVLAIIAAKGRENIAESTKNLIEADYHSFSNYQYGQDFFVGDIISYKTPSMASVLAARVIEAIYSYSTQGRNLIITIDFNNL